MLTAIYDSNCAICQTTRILMQRLDWRQQIEFLDLHAYEVVQRRFPQLEGRDLMGQMHVVDQAHAVYAGFAGIMQLLKAVPLGLPFWLIFSLPGFGRLGPLAYRWVAQNRYAINRLLGIDLPDKCVDSVCKLPE
ncbi:MAG: DUF393 domain-containing protein [Anaerolineae bacterium]|nr:DUF393 domain-containing protein [Anaerolineae bacterium]